MPDLSEAELRKQLGAWADDLAGQIPAPIQLAPWRRRARRQIVGPRRALTLAAVIALLVGPAAWWATRADPDVSVSSGRSLSVRVAYERVEYRQSADLVCPAGPLPGSGPDRATFESWADAEGDQYRNTVTYPDGSSRSVVAVGDPWWPTELYQKGTMASRPLGCAGAVGIMVAEPASSSHFSLNPPKTLPAPLPDGTARVQTYRDLGTVVPGRHRDSAGRSAELWRSTITGSLDNGESGRGRGLTQVTEWFVDPGTGRVLEETYRYNIVGIGTARSSLTLLESSSEVDVPPDFFDLGAKDTGDLEPQIITDRIRPTTTVAPGGEPSSLPSGPTGHSSTVEGIESPWV